VFDGDDVFKFNYNNPPAAAPNGPQICALVNDQGGLEQEPQQLSVYSDYECCGNPDQGHRNGTDLVETNVFRERTLGAADIGNTVTFSFDAKRGNINDPAADVCQAPNVCDVTANAFIKTLNPADGFSESLGNRADTTNLPATWGGLTVSITIPDEAAFEGQILQVGFQTNASNFEPSGNFYDNVVVTAQPTAP
jgi:hypothetical protein